MTREAIKTRIRNGITELEPPGEGYLSHQGKLICCENDWHDNHKLGSNCPECDEKCTVLTAKRKG